MTSAFEPGADQPTGTAEADALATDLAPALTDPGPVVTDDGSTDAMSDGTWWADGPLDPAAETAELIAQIRQLAAHDPSGVQQVVADVLEAINRATGGAFESAVGSLEGGCDQPVGGYDEPTVGRDRPRIEFVDLDPAERDGPDRG